MIRVAIVEDDAAARAALQEYLKRYEKETGTAVSVSAFSDAVAFLDGYRPVYDAVFFDVELPYLLGTDAAKRLRILDPLALIVFVTNMAQYAIRGYEVDAVDYLLKPVAYPRFRVLMNKLCRRLRFLAGSEIGIRTPDGLVRIHDRDLLYVSAEDHLLLYHTAERVYESWDTLKSAEALLPRERFFRIHKSVIVNLLYITIADGDTVRIGDTVFSVSRSRKKDFFAALQAALGR